MTTVPPYGLEVLGPRRRFEPDKMPFLFGGDAAVRPTQTKRARQDPRRTAGMNLELLLLLAVTVALVGAVLP